MASSRRARRCSIFSLEPLSPRSPASAFGITFVLTVVTAVDLGPRVTIVLVDFDPDDDIVVEVCARPGDETNPRAKIDAIIVFTFYSFRIFSNAFVTDSPEKRSLIVDNFPLWLGLHARE